MEGNYRIVKDIPLMGGGTISKGHDILYAHGVCYMDYVLLEKDYQDDFKQLIETENKKGWNYLMPLRDKELG